jgi:hypothetical protein
MSPYHVSCFSLQEVATSAVSHCVSLVPLGTEIVHKKALSLCCCLDFDLFKARMLILTSNLLFYDFSFLYFTAE